MLKKTQRQINKENHEQYCKRQFTIVESEHYREEFDRALHEYIVNLYPGNDVQFLLDDPDTRDDFIWSIQGLALAKKWNLQNLYDPKGDNPPLPAHEQPGKVIVRQDNPVTINEIRNHQITSTPSVRGRYLLLEIDLNNTKEVIETWVHRVIGHYWKRIDPPQKKQKKEGAINDLTMQVYRMGQAGKNLLEITHELFPETNGANPNYCNVTKKYYDKIRREYKKAILHLQRTK